MCNCASPCACDNGIDLPFITGSPGLDGLFGGFSAKWKFDVSTSSSPSAGYLHFNNANLSSVTSIYLHENNASLQDHTNFLNSVTSGKIRVFKEYDSSNVWYGQITGVTAESATVIRIDVTPIQNNATFILNDNVVVSLVEDGAQGAAGADGVSPPGGSRVIDVISDGPATTTILGDQLISEIIIPANTLENNKDVLEFYTSLFLENTGTVGAYFKLSYGNLGFLLDSNELFFNSQSIPIKQSKAEYVIEGKIYRITSSTYSLHLIISEKRMTALDTYDTAPSTPMIGTPLAFVRTGSKVQFSTDHSESNKLQIGINAEAGGTYKLYNFMAKYTKYEA